MESYINCLCKRSTKSLIAGLMSLLLLNGAFYPLYSVVEASEENNTENGIIETEINQENLPTENEALSNQEVEEDIVEEELPSDKEFSEVIVGDVSDELASVDQVSEVKEVTAVETVVDENISETEAFTLEDYQKSSATELVAAIRSGKVTSEQLVEFALQMVDETNPDLNNVITLRTEKALEEARQLEDTGQPFFGVPLLVKGLGHSTEDGTNTLGIEFMEDGTLTSRDGTFIRKFKELGFVVIGQTSYPQMGWINVTNSDLYGDTHNPWDLAHNPGGSSGGSSAAVAIGQVPIATASDAGGSTRIPAAWTGLIGYQPSRGILVGNSASDRNQTGHFAITKTMDDTEALFEALLNKEINDTRLDQSQVIAYSTQTPAGTPLDIEAVQAVKEAVALLEAQGFETVEVDYPVDGREMMMNYYTIAASNASIVNYQATRYLGRPLEKDDVELLTWALYQTAQELDADDITAAWDNIETMNQKMTEFYQQYPIFLTPTTSYTAPSADYNHIPEELVPLMEDMSGLSKDERLELIYDQWLPAWTKTPFTQLGNLSGTPSISLPTYVASDGLPLGVLFSTDRNNDYLLMELGHLFESLGQFKLLQDRVAEQPGQGGEEDVEFEEDTEWQNGSEGPLKDLVELIPEEVLEQVQANAPQLKIVLRMIQWLMNVIQQLVGLFL